MKSKLNVYWIGETTEVYLGTSIQAIKEAYEGESIVDDINDGEYGEFTSLDLPVMDEDGNSLTIKELVELYSKLENPNGMQIATAYY